MESIDKYREDITASLLESCTGNGLLKGMLLSSPDIDEAWLRLAPSFYGDAVFVFDEPTIGLHPLDVQALMNVFRHLIDNGATVIVIEHDLDVIRQVGIWGHQDGRNTCTQHPHIRTKSGKN